MKMELHTSVEGTSSIAKIISAAKMVGLNDSERPFP